MGFSVVGIEYIGELITRGKLLPRVNKWFWQNDDYGVYEVVEPFCVEVMIHKGQSIYSVEICLEEGFVTDFASTPWAVRSVFPQSMPGRNKAFAVHDKLYSDPTVRPLGRLTDLTELDRKTCDLIMKEILIDKNTISWQVSSIYSAVRAWGWKTWKKYRKNSTGKDNAPT